MPAPAVVPDEGDSNKWGRDFQELVADYSAAYDEWCQAEGKKLRRGFSKSLRAVSLLMCGCT
jgi:hypothetical protein